MKIVHVIGALAAGGAERFVVSLLKQLKKSGEDVSLWVLSSRIDKVGEAFNVELSNCEIPVYIGPTRQVGLGTLFWYGKKVRQKRPDLIHLHTPNTELVHFLTQGFKLTNSSIGSLSIYRTIHNTQLPAGWLENKAYRMNAALCTIACGKAAYDAYHKTIISDMVTIQNGVDFAYPIRTQAASLAAKKKLGINVDDFAFLNIGRMSGDNLHKAQKGHDVLIKAWKKSGLGKKQCSLHLLGDGVLKEDLEKIAGIDPSITFHGVQDNVLDWLQAADCFVMPSRYEGLPIAAIEAIGVGLPCVFSKIEPLQELSPPVVLWFDVDNTEDLAVKMCQMAEEKPRVAIQGTEEFRNVFSISAVAAQYRQVYMNQKRN